MKRFVSPAFWLSLSTAAGAVLAQFAPWLATDAKAAIAGVGAIVVAVYTHEEHSTTRAQVKAANPAPPAPVAVVVTRPAGQS